MGSNPMRGTMWKIIKTVKKGDYIYAVVPNHPAATKNGYVLEHRIVVENNIGRLLEPWEIVHHKDENKKNNHISNLEVMDRSKHVHHHKYKGKTIDLICDYCGKSFTRAWRNRPQVKGQINSFCSRACNGKFQRGKQLAQAGQSGF